MWPFKKNEPSSETYGRDLGLAPTTLEAPKPAEESYDRLTPGGLEMPSEHPSPYAPSPTSSLPQQMQQQSQSQDIQVISAKLDTIKAILDVLNQRLVAIEKNVEEKQKQKLW